MTVNDRVAARSSSELSRGHLSGSHAAEIIAAAERLMSERGTAFTAQELSREAGVALQTFYRNFESKDRVLLAAFERMIEHAVERYRVALMGVDDPVERLRIYVTTAVEDDGAILTNGPRSIMAEYWRLYELFPEEMMRATACFVDNVEREIRSAIAIGSLSSDDPAQDAWLITKLGMAIYHHRAYAPGDPRSVHAKERMWDLCFAALRTRT